MTHGRIFALYISMRSKAHMYEKQQKRLGNCDAKGHSECDSVTHLLSSLSKDGLSALLEGIGIEGVGGGRIAEVSKNDKLQGEGELGHQTGETNLYAFFMQKLDSYIATMDMFHWSSKTDHQGCCYFASQIYPDTSMRCVWTPISGLSTHLIKKHVGLQFRSFCFVESWHMNTRRHRTKPHHLKTDKDKDGQVQGMPLFDRASPLFRRKGLLIIGFCLARMAATVASLPSSEQHSPLGLTGSGITENDEQDGARRASGVTQNAHASSHSRMGHRGMIGGFSVSELERHDFDAHEFVGMARRSTPLDEICGALAGHLAELRASLIDAINQDYAAFVGMASSLKGLDKAVSKVLSQLVCLHTFSKRKLSKRFLRHDTNAVSNGRLRHQ
jgi:hypothetical protein